MKKILYLLKLWLVPAVILAWFLFICIESARQEKYNSLLSMLGIMGASILFAWFVRWKAARAVEKKFREQDVSHLLDYYTKTIRPGSFPEGQLLLDQSRVIALALYGCFSEAEELIKSHSILDKNDLFRGQIFYVYSLIKLLKREDLPVALEEAQKAQQLSAVPVAMPGTKTAQNAFDALVEIGQVLNNNLDAKIIRNLENRFEHSLFVLKLQIAWALTIAYHRLNHTEKFGRMKHFIEQKAPHCEPLLNFN